MTPQQMQEILEQSLQDEKLSRSEKSVLSQLVQEARLNAQQLATFRSTAFRLAKETMDSIHGTSIVDWLEDVVRVLNQPTVDEQPSVAEAWFSPQNDCPQRIRTLLGQAKKSVDICVFTITDDRLTNAILNTHGRGVTIRIITDNDKSEDLGSDTDRLLEAGIAVRVDRSKYHMHHKFSVFDGTLLLNGSYNWTRGAAENNEENFIVTNDRRLVTSFMETFEVLWGQLG